MVKRGNVKKVVEILKKIGRVQRNELIRIIGNDKDGMSHQTANDAINEAIESNQIIREEDQRGNQKIVWLSASPDISKNEKLLLQNLEEGLQKYDRLFLMFKDKYRNLTTQEKADGVDVFLYFLMQFNMAVDTYTTLFSRTRKWTNFMKELPIRLLDVVDLCKNDSIKVYSEIITNLILVRSLDVNDAFDDIDDFLKKLK